PNLELPEPFIRPARYRSVYDGNQYNVVEIVTGEVLGAFGREPEAREAIAALEARDASDASNVTPAKSVTPGAARTARYRARYRAADIRRAGTDAAAERVFRHEPVRP